MSDEKETKENIEKKVDVQEIPKVSSDSNSKPTEEKKAPENNFNNNNQRTFTKNRRTPRRPRQRSEFEQKILDIRRVTRVSAGGRRFSFSVAIAIGNKRGKVGVGTGKGSDIALAIQKAVKSAEQNTLQIKTTKTMSIPHEVSAKYNSAKVVIMPAPNRGIVAGSALRSIVELGGLKDVNGKIISGSKNKLNISQATVKAFASLSDTVKFSEKPEKTEERKTNKFSK